MAFLPFLAGAGIVAGVVGLDAAQNAGKSGAHGRHTADNVDLEAVEQDIERRIEEPRIRRRV